MSTLVVMLRESRSSDLVRLGAQLVGLAAFGALLYSYCDLLARAAGVS